MKIWSRSMEGTIWLNIVFSIKVLLTWKSIDTFLECEINVHLCQNWRSLMERSGGWRVRERSRCNTQTREMGDLNDCGHSAGAGTGGQAVGWVDWSPHPEPRDAKSQEIDNIYRHSDVCAVWFWLWAPPNPMVCNPWQQSDAEQSHPHIHFPFQCSMWSSQAVKGRGSEATALKHTTVTCHVMVIKLCR